MEEKDFFGMYFDMSKYPSAFDTEAGKEERKKLSCFFTKHRGYYLQYIRKLGYNSTFFSLAKPFNMLYGLYGSKLFFVISNKNALMGRTALYRVNEGTVLDTNILSELCRVCGLEDRAIISDVDIELYISSQTNEYDEQIKKEAESLVDYEIKEFERSENIMNIKPFFGNTDFSIDDKKVFMLMPFGNKELNEFYEDHIKTVVKSLGLNCIRADDIFNNKSIIEDIWKNINESRIIIADLTYRNPNVFYEIGIAHTVGKEVILISQVEEDIPFDLRHIRTIFYKITPRGAKEFETVLSETIKKITQELKVE